MRIGKLVGTDMSTTSSGQAFEMSRADASRAIQNLNGKALGGRALRVNEAQERQRAPRGSKRW